MHNARQIGNNEGGRGGKGCVNSKLPRAQPSALLCYTAPSLPFSSTLSPFLSHARSTPFSFATFSFLPSTNAFPPVLPVPLHPFPPSRAPPHWPAVVFMYPA